MSAKIPEQLKIENAKFALDSRDPNNPVLIKWGLLPRGEGTKLIAFKITLAESFGAMVRGEDFVGQSEKIAEQESQNQDYPVAYEWAKGAFEKVQTTSVTWFQFSL